MLEEGKVKRCVWVVGLNDCSPFSIVTFVE
jgi:hypothetical protein